MRDAAGFVQLRDNFKKQCRVYALARTDLGIRITLTAVKPAKPARPQLGKREILNQGGNPTPTIPGNSATPAAPNSPRRRTSRIAFVSGSGQFPNTGNRESSPNIFSYQCEDMEWMPYDSIHSTSSHLGLGVLEGSTSDMVVASQYMSLEGVSPHISIDVFFTQFSHFNMGEDEARIRREVGALKEILAFLFCVFVFWYLGGSPACSIGYGNRKRLV
ncbi:hypothetical protein BDW02DRAFT_578547 [Decorospora gaudefroyi]|uniref:Uncharacterized protein n=1 Tax=Decorospora gaudefroyi TaxID=184978 RepID=A0A6A5KJ80_9PLEO|nr:hypothetical protein BDW02DRAFT_578547 [Decorospora gaudefroyi]